MIVKQGVNLEKWTTAWTSWYFCNSQKQVLSNLKWLMDSSQWKKLICSLSPGNAVSSKHLFITWPSIIILKFHSPPLKPKKHNKCKACKQRRLFWPGHSNNRQLQKQNDHSPTVIIATLMQITVSKHVT